MTDDDDGFIHFIKNEGDKITMDLNLKNLLTLLKNNIFFLKR